MNGVIPWPTLIQERLPNNPLWPSMYYLFWISILVFVAEWWETWFAVPSRNAHDSSQGALGVPSEAAQEFDEMVDEAMEKVKRGRGG